MEFQRTDNGESTRLEIDGELDAITAMQLREPFDSLVEENVNAINVDLSKLRLVDSSGVGALVSLYKRVRARGGDVLILNATGQPAAIFKLLKLDAVFGPQCIQPEQREA